MASTSCSLVSILVTLCLCSVALAANPYTGYQQKENVAYEAADPIGWGGQEAIDMERRSALYNSALLDTLDGGEELLEDGEQLGAASSAALEKRGGRLPVAFMCTPKTAGCLNGGRGPKITPLRSHKLAMCVCLCPTQLKGPRCTKVKRRYRW